LNPIGNKTVMEGSLLSFAISGSDSDGDVLTYSVAQLPRGASFNTATRTFSWRPAHQQIGNHQVTFHISDGFGEVDSETISITVTAFSISAPDYFPLNIGDWWDYHSSSTGEINRTNITGPVYIGGVPTKALNYSDGYADFYTSDMGGIQGYGSRLNEPGFYTGNVIYDSPVLLISNNAKLYSTQSSSFSFTLLISDEPLNFNVTSTTTIFGLEEVKTANAILSNCIKVSIRDDVYIVELNEYLSVTVYYWLYKGVGIVKETFDGETSLITQSNVNGVYRSY